MRFRTDIRSLRVATLVFAWGFLGFAMSPAESHELRPGYLELTEQADGKVSVLWKQPVVGEFSISLRPTLSSGWLEQYPGALSSTGTYLLRQWEIPPGAEKLAGQTATILGLEQTLTDVLLRVTFVDGVTMTQLLKPASPSMEITRDATGARFAYLSLGIHHILLGIDHLCFVLGLLILVRGKWGLMIKTISAFTVAHSLTLAASTLGIVSIPIDPLNAVVALSILFLGVEVLRQHRGETSLTIEHPWIAAFGFGLIHGFGFASGLSTVGLPSAEILVALLLFNLGVEIGQLAFVGLYLTVRQSLKVLEVEGAEWTEAIPAYVVGTLGAYWTIAQMAILLRMG